MTADSEKREIVQEERKEKGTKEGRHDDEEEEKD